MFEACGHKIGAESAGIGRGIKRINDPHLRDELDEGEVAIAIEEWHRYAMDWSSKGVAIYIDDELVMQADQSPQYPMQLMLNLYDLPGAYDRNNPVEARFEIDYVRAYGPA